jgi:tetratricopeptide (TPR) repeat protein
MDLGRAYRQAGEPRQARTLLESVVASRQKALGVADLKTIQAETLLAFALADMGELKRSRLIQKDVLERCDEQFGRQSEQSIAAAINLANTYRKLKQYPKEGPLRTRILEHRTSLFGERHIETIKSLADMAVLKRHQGEFQAAVILDHAILENIPRSQVSARELLSFKFNMVTDLMRLKKWSEATEMFDEAYDEATLHLSPDDTLRRNADRYKSKLRYMGKADAKTRSRREKRQPRT